MGSLLWPSPWPSPRPIPRSTPLGSTTPTPTPACTAPTHMAATSSPLSMAAMDTVSSRGRLRLSPKLILPSSTALVSTVPTPTPVCTPYTYGTYGSYIKPAVYGGYGYGRVFKREAESEPEADPALIYSNGIYNPYTYSSVYSPYTY